VTARSKGESPLISFSGIIARLCWLEVPSPGPFWSCPVAVTGTRPALLSAMRTRVSAPIHA